MKDLKTRFEGDLERLADPPAWRDIASRAATPGVSPEIGAEGGSPRRRYGAMLLAATVTTALVAGLVWVAADRPEPPLPPSQEPSATNVVRITCLGDGQERLSSDTVAVQPDGIHLEIVQDHPGPPSQVGTLVRRYGFQGFYGNAPKASGEVTNSSMYVATGPLPLFCLDGTHRLPERAEFLTVNVVDPDGIWVSTRLSCEADGKRGQIATDGVNLKGVAIADVPQVLIRRTEGFLPTDRVEPAGFPEAEFPTFRAVRDGRVIARWQLIPGPLFADIDWCRGIGDPTQ